MKKKFRVRITFTNCGIIAESVREAETRLQAVSIALKYAVDWGDIHESDITIEAKEVKE